MVDKAGHVRIAIKLITAGPKILLMEFGGVAASAGASASGYGWREERGSLMF